MVERLQQPEKKYPQPVKNGPALQHCSALLFCLYLEFLTFKPKNLFLVQFEICRHFLGAKSYEINKQYKYKVPAHSNSFLIQSKVRGR